MSFYMTTEQCGLSHWLFFHLHLLIINRESKNTGHLILAYNFGKMLTDFQLFFHRRTQ